MGSFATNASRDASSSPPSPFPAPSLSKSFTFFLTPLSWVHLMASSPLELPSQTPFSCAYKGVDPTAPVKTKREVFASIQPEKQRLRKTLRDYMEKPDFKRALVEMCERTVQDMQSFVARLKEEECGSEALKLVQAMYQQIFGPTFRKELPPSTYLALFRCEDILKEQEERLSRDIDVAKAIRHEAAKKAAETRKRKRDEETVQESPKTVLPPRPVFRRR